METRLRLADPHERFKDSYRRLVSEFVELAEPLVPFPLLFSNVDFSAFLEKLAACERGEGVPEGFVPHSTVLAGSRRFRGRGRLESPPPFDGRLANRWRAYRLRRAAQCSSTRIRNTATATYAGSCPQAGHQGGVDHLRANE